MDMTTKDLGRFICPDCDSDEIEFDHSSIDMIDEQDGYMNIKCNECRSRYKVDVRLVYFPDGVEKL
jgi:transcription elongation factor Elf1